jgi:ADP-dependent NAD(P)H-hydrate dehydratase
MSRPEGGPGGPPSAPVVVTPAVLRDWPLPEGDDKESRGRTLIVGGSEQTPGAVLLAAEAALRTGAGKLQVATVDRTAVALAIALPEGLVRPLATTASGDIDPAGADVVVDLAEGCSSVLLGSGALDADSVLALLDGVVPRLRPGTTAVLDAMAMAWVGAHPDGLRHLAGDVVLTPNVKELALTLDVGQQRVADDPAGAARELALATGAVVCLGGSQSHVVEPGGGTWRDDTGGRGLGVSGSGDVLAGIVTGLAARGASAAQAAVWGTFLHGRSGDRLAAAVGRMGFLAREVLPEVPRVLAEIEV